MTHEFNGEEYRKASTHQKEWGNKIIAEFSFKGNERILDLGCGDGVLTAQLAELVPEGWVLGIDASQSMIEVAQKQKKNNLAFRLLDINSLDFREEFDLVFSNATLHWVKDHNRLLNNVYISLRKGGEARFNFGAEGNCIYFIKVIREAMESPDYSGYFKTFEWPWYMPPIKEYEQLVRRFAFREIKVWGEVADRHFPDQASLIKWVDQPSLVPFLESVTGSDKKKFRDYVVEKMVQETLQPDGRCFETFRRINLRARK
jgi:trans-aconitate 2-methyltransferase